MNRILKSVGGALFGVLFLLVVASDVASAAGGIGNTIDPCLNGGGAFGFVFCPAVNMFAGVIDYFLNTMQTGFNWAYLISSSGDGLGDRVISVWSSILPIANVLFALVFMFVIYSVATGQGLNNYSIKKIMPRLVLVAVAINVSYYICAALIDISNIVGAGIYDLIFGTLSGGSSGGGLSFVSLANDVFDSSGTGAALIGATADADSGSIGALLLLVANMAVILLAVGAVFVCVAARNVLLMLLLLASPLAFSTALLPNTENIFRKWGNNLLRLLVIYPAFMFVWAICLGLQAAFVESSDASALELILAMLLSVAPVLVIIPLFKGTGGLTGKIANVIQQGSAGFSPGNITNNQTNNNKTSNQNIDQINQKKFSTDKSIKTTNTANSRDGGVQNTFSDESNSVLNSRTTQAASEIGVTADPNAAGGKSQRSRALSANLKSQVDVANAQKAVSSTLSSLNNSNVSNASSSSSSSSSHSSDSSSFSNSSNSSSSSSLSSAISSQVNNASASNVSRSMVSQNNNNNNNNLMNQVQNATTNNSSNSSNSKESKIDLSGEFDKLADVVKTKSQSQPLSRERATAAAKAATPTPTLNRQSFTEGSSGDKKAEKTFDVASKDPTTNIFSGDGQQVSIENSGETSQLVEQKILDGPAMVDGAPSIVPDGEIEQPGEPENPDEDAAPGAPSIVPDVITDNDRKDRFASETGQKELAKMLTVVNIKQLLPSDIDYILGIGPLLSTDGEELAPTNDMSKEPEYAIAAQVVAGYISTLSDDEKNDANVLKWQKHLGLL